PSQTLRADSLSVGGILHHLDAGRSIFSDADGVRGQFTFLRMEGEAESALHQILKHRTDLHIAWVAPLRKFGDNLVPLGFGPIRQPRDLCPVEFECEGKEVREAGAPSAQFGSGYV